jgi:hypothetical protein
MRNLVLAAAVALAACGCGGGKEEKTAIRLEDVPAPAMKTAREKLPDATFTEAYLKKDGTYEVRGKLKSGKVREVEVKADGTFVDLE